MLFVMCAGERALIGAVARTDLVVYRDDGLVMVIAEQRKKSAYLEFLCRVIGPRWQKPVVGRLWTQIT